MVSIVRMKRHRIERYHTQPEYGNWTRCGMGVSKWPFRVVWSHLVNNNVST